MPARIRQIVVATLLGLVAVTAGLLVAGPAAAHGFSSTVYVTLTSDGDAHLRTKLELEYDLLVVSTADFRHDDPLFRAGTAAFDAGDSAAELAAINGHQDSVMGYVTDRFTIEGCTPAVAGDFALGEQEGVPYADMVLDWTCPSRLAGRELHSGLFPDSEGYVKGTKTIVTYVIDGRSGSAALDAAHPSFSTGQAAYQRFWEFFRLGAEHLLGGIDHILFLLALIVGSRRPREIVLAATSFTLAHSVTFILAALGVVDVPPRVVEPIIALSIAVVAGWYLWRLWRRGDHAMELASPDGGHFALDRSGWGRLAVVFGFGLVHGLGFAGALGIDEAWSWTLLWSLLVFNVGIEVVQLALIAAVFPLLMVLRRRSPRAGLWVSGVVSAGVSAMGLIWFVERVSGS
ncbi:HupE / UreJ protein [Asanoa hainanensis]|uniref:HupE / UreJ protein n=1 Tax=Asanoa hainanensis TaxID=560556 RepID=A0A239MTF0_9ACTN|nr:HupE/UreJ family protein [Asanoa hainanensis]SNT45523.1 HupE / UreJ protein [Asanoa hainanensis]